jgi:hypothetical protein
MQMVGARSPRTIEQVREFMRKNGPLPSSAIATSEPVSVAVGRKAEQVAQRLVGGLPASGSSGNRVVRLAVKLAKLVEVDAAAADGNGSRVRPQRRAARG